jgi:photoactive yellow protein
VAVQLDVAVAAGAAAVAGTHARRPLFTTAMPPPEPSAAGDAATLPARADDMSPAELDRLPYGMIQLDPRGRILQYNAVESRLASLPQAQQVGRNFFTQVAPCTKVQEFYGRFKEGVARESLDGTFHFHFAFKQHPRDVTVRLFYSRRTRTVWVMISDREGRPIG